MIVWAKCRRTSSNIFDGKGKKKENNAARPTAYAGNTKGGSITVPLTSCLTGLD
jgi:hypothetical protein